MKRLILSDEQRLDMNRGIKLRGNRLAENLSLVIQRPTGHSLQNDVVAVGQYNQDSARWDFQSNEDSLKQWLEVTFNQPMNSRHGQLPINSIEFIEQIQNTVLTRRGLTLTTR